MQNLHISGNCDNKFYHYCYVCNTQLNSCKQALLHCSGKRHRKKLEFLQTRKGGHFGGSVTPMAADAERNNFPFPPASSAPQALPPGSHPGALASGLPPTLVGANASSAPGGPPMIPQSPPGHVQLVHNAAAALPGCFYPVMTPIEHWLTPAPPAFAHFHGQYGAMPTPPLFRPQGTGSHFSALPPMPPPEPVNRNGKNNALGKSQLPLRPLLRYHQSFWSNGSNSPVMLTDTSAFGSGSSTGARSVVISPSETSSISSESLVSPKTRLLYRCQVCQRQFVTNVHLQVHLQASRHYKQYLLQAEPHTERTGDSSETESWVSSPSIYYCMVCNIAVNTPAQLEAHTASHRHKVRMPMSAAGASQRVHSRSSSTSSETPVEFIMDSGYVSGSGDELICITHPTPEKPTAKFRCQICNIFLNSPAQAKQHLSSQKHLQRIGSFRMQFRRKSSSNFKRKQAPEHQIQKQQSQQGGENTTASSEVSVPPKEEDCASLSAATRSLSPADDDFEESLDENDDDNVTMVRCHSL